MVLERKPRRVLDDRVRRQESIHGYHREGHRTAGEAHLQPLTKPHKAKLVSALEKWRASLTDEERAALAERNRQTQRERWNNMSERERGGGGDGG